MLLFKLIENITIVRTNLIDIIETCSFLISKSQPQQLGMSEILENKKRYFNHEPTHRYF
jgi:hypothetical protein